MRNTLAAFLLLFMLNLPACAQSPAPTTLQLRKSIQKNLAAGQVHQYKLPLKVGQFASIRIYQESVGVAYAVVAPNDSLIDNADYNALYQYEVIAIHANKTGDYSIDVFWDYGKPEKGNYSIELNVIEPIGATKAAQADQLFRSWYDTNAPGAAVLVISNDQVVYKSARGMASLEHKIPISTDSPFELASVSKQFTAFAIAQLIDKGLLSLDDDIRKFLPEVPDFGSVITVKNLVYHTSGRSNWDNITNASGYRAEDVISQDMVMKIVSRQQKLMFKPGEGFSYSNTNYNLLAKIVEAVTGKSFAVWSHENIFKPIGMNNTFIKDDIQQVIPGKVNGYRASVNGFKFIPDNFSVPGSTSVYSSVDDLQKWVNNFTTGIVGGKSVLEIMRTPGKLNNGQPLGYSFGNFSDDYKGIFKREHLGLVLGFRTAIARYPQQKLAVVYLANDANDATFFRSSRIAEVFLTDVKHTALQERPLPAIDKYLEAIKPFGKEKSADVFKEYEGVFFSEELNTALTIKTIDGVMTIVFPRVEDIKMKLINQDLFKTSFPSFQREVEFQRNTDKKVTGLFLTGGGTRIFFAKML